MVAYLEDDHLALPSRPCFRPSFYRTESPIPVSSFLLKTYITRQGPSEVGRGRQKYHLVGPTKTTQDGSHHDPIDPPTLYERSHNTSSSPRCWFRWYMDLPLAEAEGLTQPLDL